MRRFALLVTLVSTFVLSAMAQTSNWATDQAHSKIDFSILHLAISKVRGSFGNITGDMVFDRADLAKSKVNFNIDVSSIDTGMSPRDSVLKSDSFFDVRQYPDAKFASTSVMKNGAGLKVEGNLTLRGITRPVVLTVERPNGPMTGPDHKQRIGFAATTEISRKDFGIGAAFPANIVGDQVQLTIYLEMIEK